MSQIWFGLAGGGASNSFTIIQPDSGTSPTAGSSSDTLTFHNSDTNISIVGNSGTKTITFNLATNLALAGTLKSGNYHLEPIEFDSGNSTTSKTIDWSNGSVQKSTLTGNVTYTFSNGVIGGAYILKIATGAGSFTATWPAAVKWSGGTAPTITATASKVDLINFYYDGTNWFGSFIQNF